MFTTTYLLVWQRNFCNYIMTLIVIRYEQYGHMGCQVPKNEIQNQIAFCQRSTYAQRKLLYFINKTSDISSKSVEIGLSKSIYFLKWCLIFDDPISIHKIQNFLYLCKIFGKNLSNFEPLPWKLDNPYCQSD